MSKILPYGKLKLVLKGEEIAVYSDPWGNGAGVQVARVCIGSGPAGIGIRVEDMRLRLEDSPETLEVFYKDGNRMVETVLSDGSEHSKAHHKWYRGEGPHPEGTPK